MMRMLGVGLIAVLATGVVPAGSRGADAAEKGKAGSNLAHGDIGLLHNAGKSRGKVKAKGRGRGKNALGAAGRVKYFNTMKKIVRDY